MKKQISSTYLVAKYLQDKNKGQICDMKRCCKANNIGQRVLSLRNTFNWKIETKLLEYKNGVAIYEYTLIEQGSMPKKYRK